MTRYERTELPKYFNGNTYTAWKKKAKRYTKEEIYEHYPEEFPAGSLESLTVPGQAVTIKELNERYEKGRPIPVE